MFGGDAVERKFGLTPPPEWIAMIARLSDFQIQQGIRRLAYSGKAHVPTLPEFARMCREIGGEYEEGPKRPALPAPKPLQYDGWAMVANIRFWKYITHRLTEAPRAWGPAGSVQQQEATQVAVRYKNAWAQDMRESGESAPETGEIIFPDHSSQGRSFAECMRRAEVEIEAVRKRFAPPVRGKAA
jgi:hypothetical protein